MEISEVRIMSKLLSNEEVVLMIDNCHNIDDDRYCDICPLAKECLHFTTGENCGSCLEIDD